MIDAGLAADLPDPVPSEGQKLYDEGNTGPALSQIEDARSICQRCSVVEDCLTWALESGQDAGVWGGLSEDERRALKRRNARARARLA